MTLPKFLLATVAGLVLAALSIVTVAAIVRAIFRLAGLL